MSVFNFYPVKELKPGTQVIATFSDPRAKMADGREQPFLAMMPYGTGKVSETEIVRRQQAGWAYLRP